MIGGTGYLFIPRRTGKYLDLMVSEVSFQGWVQFQKCKKGKVDEKA